MSFENIVVGNYGIALTLTIKQDGDAVDLSGFTTKQFIFTKPDGTTLTKIASFVTDGADGKLRYVVEQGDIDAAGSWKLRARLANDTQDIKSVFLYFTVRS